MTTKKERRIKIKTRIRGKVSGSAERPRMSVFRSNKQIYVQLIDDVAGRTLVSASSKGIEDGISYIVQVDETGNETWYMVHTSSVRKEN